MLRALWSQRRTPIDAKGMRPMSPLLQPADCCVLLIDPRTEHIADFDPEKQQALAQNLDLVEQAVQLVAVPRHLAFVGNALDPQQWLAGLGETAQPRLHVLGSTGSSWSNSGLAAALAADRRASLILCGFWLETTVTFVALPALASGFDVFVLTDLTPARADRAHRPAAHRLFQAGVVPLTTHQLVAEWTEASADPERRARLSRLIIAG
jgi:hypothetical protein